MGIKKFIKKVKSTLDLTDNEVKSKKKALKDLIKKLNSRKKSIKKSLDTASKKKKKELNEELEIVTCQIKKGKNILHDLYSDKNTKSTK